MLTKKEATKLRKLIREYAGCAVQLESSLLQPMQGDIDWRTETEKACKDLYAYIEKLSTEKPVSKMTDKRVIRAMKGANREAQLIAINQAISDPDT